MGAQEDIALSTLAMIIAFFSAVLGLFMFLLPYLFKFLRFTGLWIPIVAFIGACYIPTPVDPASADLLLKAIFGFLGFTCFIALLILVGNIIRIFKYDFSYFRLIKNSIHKRRIAKLEKESTFVYHSDGTLECDGVKIDLEDLKNYQPEA